MKSTSISAAEWPFLFLGLSRIIHLNIENIHWCTPDSNPVQCIDRKRRLAEEQLLKQTSKEPRPERKREKPRKWIRPDALIIRPAEKEKYAEILRRIKQSVPDEQVRTTVEKIHKTNTGDMLITLSSYMIHESGVWSNIHKCWFFIPRRCSVKQYNETEDEKMSCNVLLKADEEFNHVEVTQLNNWIPIRGFSSFKFLPGSEDKIIIALKTEEYQSQTATYITAFTINGKLLLPDLKIGDYKYEGFEFI
ncbi:Similar to Cant1: Soluble calcium-activated nucleotidase 1 (Rattus norvegicus) [Cotesia congregata]|uniref:Similar to Cant1: Soluble calcium-activated nucleotidase 1 (Rattus norvegicus) n=1 Tax=Cotesia congregata TaxID=51543 RepID=A0A8J2HCE5_COTCN|nr:Similar to Cant1: Soluble calcium-activated nucleotidase 1 (Rattus norvegicus) [Cotesia congregata]